MLLRLEHLFEENETNNELSQPVTVTVTDNFFSTFTIINVQEMSLGGNILKTDVNRIHWTQENSIYSYVSSDVS